MLKINQTFFRLFLIFTISFFLLFVTTYFSLRPAVELLEAYNDTWIKLGIAFLFILVLIYLSIKSVSYKLSEDVEHFQDYLEEVSNKNYQAVVNIKYFHEFLEMSLHLKNVVKRLNNKDTKKK